MQQLEALWLNDNLITKMKGLNKCTNLKKLHLTGNKINKIEGIDKLRKLEVLWLAENNISAIQNLKNLTQLKELNLASNRISVIGTSLDPLKNLEELNLANNRIGNLKELLNLNRLQKLRVTAFLDEHYGENPICNLCNYQTYVLYHLPKLEILDMMVISEDSKALAEATFMKKRMFYNMKIKTMQRIASNIVKSVKGSKRLKIFKLNKEIDFLLLKLKETVCEIEEVAEFGPDPKEEAKVDKKTIDFDSKKVIIQGRIYDKLEDITDIETICESVKKKCYDISEENIHRLITELETGGNIRFEEGKNSEKWFKSCSELIRSRFRSEQLAEYGIVGMNITRITRIHNRFLRNQFEDKLEQLIDLCDKSLKKSLDYLFYGSDPRNPNEMFKVMEEGFKCTSHTCIPLVNSVVLAELPRINHYLTNGAGFAQLRSNTKSLKAKEARMNQELAFEKGLIHYPPGCVLICKVYTSNPMQDNSKPNFDPLKSPADNFEEFPIQPGLGSESQGQCIYRVNDADPNQKLFIFSDPTIILPEYIAEFEYVGLTEEKGRQNEIEINNEFDLLSSQLASARQTIAASYQQMVGKSSMAVDYGTMTAIELDRCDLGCLKKTLTSIMKSCCIDEGLKNGIQFALDSAFMEKIESLQPAATIKEKWGSITTDRLLGYCKKRKELHNLSYLNLNDSNIHLMENLSQLSNLRVLVLSFNNITKIQGLEDNLMLERLELGHNQIAKIENMETLAKLKVFEINNNYITSANDLRHIKNYNPHLEELQIRNNPFTSSKNYKAKVLEILPDLKRVDGFSVLEKDKQSVALSKETMMTKDLISNNAKFSNALPGTSEQQQYEEETSPLSGGKDISPRKLSTETQNWEQRVEELNLSHKKIANILNIQDFTCLRRLLLADNKISKIEGLENCKLLEELNLEKNKITVIENISHLIFLKKLDIGKNRIQAVTGVNGLENLVQLSLEDNEIQSLDGFPILKNLMELYIGNNLISDFKEVKVLRQLTKLIILDISGNKICQDAHYRLYIIFHLKKLKVLDGISIEQLEFNESKNAYSGKLTEEILESKLNGKTVKTVVELDLSSCKLRDFDGMFDENTFSCLQVINISNNFFASLRAFGYLPKLSVLLASSNKIETLYCKQEDKTNPRGLMGMLVFKLLYLFIESRST